MGPRAMNDVFMFLLPWITLAIFAYGVHCTFVLLKKSKRKISQVRKSIAASSLVKEIEKIATLKQSGIYDENEFKSKLTQIKAKLSADKENTERVEYLLKLAKMKQSGLVTSEDIEFLRH